MGETSSSIIGVGIIVAVITVVIGGITYMFRSENTSSKIEGARVPKSTESTESVVIPDFKPISMTKS